MNPICKQCGQREVEDARVCFATPVCFACLRDHWKLRAERAEYALGPYLCPKCQKCLTPQEVRRGGLYCTHPETTSAGWCPDCEQELNLLPVCDACGHKELSHTRTRECMEWKCACERFEPGPSPVAAPENDGRKQRT